MLPVVPEVHGVTGQDDVAGLRQAHEQRLMPRRVAGRRQDRHAAVAEHVVITGKPLEFL